MDFIIKEIKKMNGKFLGIGITSEKVKNEIISNNKLSFYELLEEPKNKLFNPKKLRKNNQKKIHKKVNIKKIKKRYKKKKIDYIICNFHTISKFTKTFVRDSIYINKGYLYIYGTKEQLLSIKEKYLRYTNDIKLKKDKDIYVLIVNNTNTKNHKLKDIAYWWKDTITNILDFLTVLLVN